MSVFYYHNQRSWYQLVWRVVLEMVFYLLDQAQAPAARHLHKVHQALLYHYQHYPAYQQVFYQLCHYPEHHRSADNLLKTNSPKETKQQ
jgi:hypothetical protein